MTKHTTTALIATVAFLIGAAVSAGVFYRAKPACPERGQPAGVEEMARRVWDMEVREAERELREALKRDPGDGEAVRRFVGRVKAAAQPKQEKRPFGSL